MQWWGGGGKAEWAEDRRWTDGGLEEVVKIRDLHADTEEEAPKVETGVALPDERVALQDERGT